MPVYVILVRGSVDFLWNNYPIQSYNEISLIGYFVYVLGGFNFACLCCTSQGSVDFFWNKPIQSYNEMSLTGYFVYVFGGFNFACLFYTSQGECGFFLE